MQRAWAASVDTDPLCTVLTQISHGAVMSVTWGILVIAGVTIARYYRRKPWWVDAHIRIQGIGTAGTVSGAAVAISMVKQQAGSLHAMIGLCLAAAVGGCACGGVKRAASI
jgi:hypothetical protein